MSLGSVDDLELRREDAGAAEPRAPRELAGKSPFRIAMSRLFRDKVAVVCMAILVVLVLLGVLAPLINGMLGIHADYDDPNAPRPSDVLAYDGLPAVGPPFEPFTWDHPLGVAPQTGLDNLAVLLLGLRTSLLVAVLAALLTTVVGVTLGLIGGYSRGVVDSVLSFVTDFFLSFPFILGALALAPIITSRFGDDAEALKNVELIGLVGILVIFGWMSMTRLIRGQVLSLREREFVMAARVIGVPTWKILFKEILPNLVAPIVVAFSLALPAYVAAEAGLSYLGIGLSEWPSLGRTINKATRYYEDYPLYLWVPVATVMVLVVALNLLGDSVRDAFDPKTRR